jgi:hypothetical protein
LEHDFERELAVKKECQKQKMIRQIRESLKFLNPGVLGKPVNAEQPSHFFNHIIVN